MVQAEFQRRRRQLMRMMGPGSIAIVPAGSQPIRNRDVHFTFRPDSDFYYLTGFVEPEAVAVLIPGRPQGEYILFCSERDPEKELWDGLVVGNERAVSDYAADDSFPITDLDDILPGMLEQRDRAYYALGCNPSLDKRLADWVNEIRNKSRTGVHGPIEFIALDHYLHDMRLYKSRAEISLLRRAAKISVNGHKRLIRDCRPTMYEYELEAAFVYECARQGARHQAYPPIVGGGNNACTLHYIDNKARLADGDLVLVDAGCELEYYASDITRTFPVNGKFTEPQRLLYELVLAGQEAAISQVKPGNHWNDPHEAAVKTITRGLIKLGLLKGQLSRLLKEEQYKKFYMHRTGHWMGMDVHDVGDYKVDGHWRQLEPGMVMTVEPGLYIGMGEKGVARKWQGMGIRIEDDVLVTKDGCDLLTKGLPRTVEEIEAMMAA